MVESNIKKYVIYYFSIVAFLFLELISVWGLLNLFNTEYRVYYTFNFEYNDIITTGLYGGQTDIITFLFGLIFGFVILLTISVIDNYLLGNLLLENISLMDSILAVLIFISIIFVFNISFITIILTVSLLFFSTRRGVKFIKRYVFYQEELSEQNE